MRPQEEPREHLLEALSLQRSLGNRRAEPDLLNALAVIEAGQGRMDEALELYQAALPILRECGDRRGEASVLGNLGNVFGERGRLKESRLHHEAASRSTESRATADSRE